MTTLRTKYLGIILGLAALLMTGCLEVGTEGTEGTEETENYSEGEPTSLDASDFGGYTTDDELPAFNIESLIEVGSDTEVMINPAIDIDTEEELTDDPDNDVYMVRFVWGNLETNAHQEVYTGTVTLYDWTGSLSLDGGPEGESYLFLKKTILFDAYDTIVSNEETVIEWESRTGPHIDGVLVKVIVPADADPEDITLTFSTTSYETSLTVAEIDRYNEIVTIDEDGSGVAITGLKPELDDDCAVGFMQGKYRNRLMRAGGIFRGRFLSERGVLLGHLRGHYGLTPGGERLLFGKYIGTTGLFRGRLSGEYGDGAFSGSWHDRNGVREGILDGKYVTGETVNSGFFQGFWEEPCE